MKGKQMRVVVEVLSDELQEVHLIPMFSANKWSNSTSYTVTAGKIERNSDFRSWPLRSIGSSDKDWIPMPDCSDEWEVVVKIIHSILLDERCFCESSCTQHPNSSESDCIDIKQHCSDYFPLIGKVLEDLKTDAVWLSKSDYHSISSMQNSWLPPLRCSTLTVKPVEECNKQAVDYQKVFAHFDFPNRVHLLASGRDGKKVIERNDVYGNYLLPGEEIIQENPYEASLLRGLSLAPPEFPKIACPWTRELPLEEMGIHTKKLFLGSFEKEAIMPKSTNCIEGLNEQAMEYQRVFAHFARDGKKVVQGNDVYGNNLVQGEENLYQVPPLAPPEFPKIEGPWTRELPLEEMGIHTKKLFLGSFEKEAIMPKSTNCIEGLNEQAMEYQRVFAHFARDGKKVFQGNDVYGNNLVQGEENLYQVPPLAPPEFPKIEGPWTRELALAVMAMSASASYTTPSVIAKAFCAMAFAATATSFWLPGKWKRVLTKFGAIASIGGVLAAIGYGLPIECIWVGALAFLVPAVAVAFS